MFTNFSIKSFNGTPISSSTLQGLFTFPEIQNILVPVFDSEDINFTARITTPIKAPVTKGATIGNLVIARPNLPTFEIPLIAAENIGSGGFKEKVLSAAKFVLSSISQNPEAAF